jgi:hypothetical protein
MQIIAGAHYDLQARRRRDARQRFRVTAYAAARRINDGVAARCGEQAELVDRRRLVIKSAIVEIHERVHAELADNAGVNRTGGEMLPLRLDGLVPPAAAVVEDVLVH